LDIHDYAGAKKISLRRINDFTTGVNPLGPSGQAKHAIRKIVRGLDTFPDESVRYLTEYLARTEGIGKDCLLFGAGSTHLLGVLLKAVGPASVGVLSPISPRFGKMLSLHGVNVESVSVDEEREFSVDADELRKLMGRVDLMILSRPHEVTGAVIPDEEMGLLIAEADRLGKVLVIDEAYRDYTAVASPLKQAAASGSTVVLRTFSLFHALAGLRLGYGAGSSMLIEKMKGVLPSSPVNGLAPRAAIASLKDDGLRKRTLEFIEEEKAYFRKKLGGNEAISLIDTPCNFVLLSLQGDLDGLRKSFMERNILVDGFPGREGTVYLRLPVKRHKANAFFMRTLLRITGVRS